MIKVVTIVGARPQIIKAAAISRAIKEKYSNRIQESIVHTGQHYDENMSSVFFKELGIPTPYKNLNIGSKSHGQQTAEMMVGIEELLHEEKPDCVLVYGDTNSTLAASLAAIKLGIPIVHVEAGLRSFNKSMPEEINRITCDHSSTLLFSPTQQGIDNLLNEGFTKEGITPYTVDNPGVFHSGDVMYDNAEYFKSIAVKESTILDELEITPGSYCLTTVHRDFNTDNSQRLNGIFEAMLHIAESGQKLVIPLHPRTKKLLENTLNSKNYAKVIENSNIQIIPPVSFLDMVQLEKNCSLVITDSGGVQKEAYFYKKPCIILRPETEWVELVETGNAVISNSDADKIIQAFDSFKNDTNRSFPNIFGDGNAAEFICEKIIETF